MNAFSKKFAPSIFAARRQLSCLVLTIGVSVTGCVGGTDSEPEPAEPAVSPAAEPAAGPGAEPAVEPAVEPAAEPGANPEPAPGPGVEPECGADEQSATCLGAVEISVCNQGTVSTYSCETICQQDGLPGGTCGPAGGNDDCFCDDTPPPANRHGDLCVPETSGACGFPSSGLLCVVENQGDSQGVCRLVCSSTECLFNEDAVNALDTECCDVFNGSRVCANDQVYPGACQDG